MADINGTMVSETLTGTSGYDSIWGSGGDDTLYGLGAKDTLDGGQGNDVMLGGADWDVYYVQQPGDQIVELDGEGGGDRVYSFIDYTLPAGVYLEWIVLLGTAVSGTGNDFDNFLLGNAGANVLNGLGGVDVLKGGAGADVLYGGNGNDQLTWDSADTLIDGGAGYDTLYVNDEDSNQLDLTSLDDGRILGIEAVVVSGSAGGRVILSAGDVIAMSDTDGLTINGTGVVQLRGSWTFGGSSGSGWDTYLNYSQGGAQVSLQAGLQIVLSNSNARDVSSPGPGRGFTLTGASAGDAAGTTAKGAGDVNGDGFGDLIVSAPGADAGASAYVVFGAATAASTNLSSIDGTNGFRLLGGVGDGAVVASAGDVNADGFADVIIGCPDADANGTSSGATYVVFGGAGSSASEFALSELDGSNGFRIVGAAEFDRSGASVSAAGDINGDGFGDIIIGAPGASPNGKDSGASYVVFGKAGGFSASIDLSTLDGANGFQIFGSAAGDVVGTSVSAAGDVNGDGFDDLVIGAPGVDGSGNRTGAAYVVFGSDAPFAGNLELSDLDGSNGFRIRPAGYVAYAGFSVSGAGDVNGDGFADILVGAPALAFGRFYGGPGHAYVIYGHAGAHPDEFALSSLDGSNGFALVGLNDYESAGWQVSAAGDANGDGFDDLLISQLKSAFDADGASYLVFGRSGVVAPRLALGDLGDPGSAGYLLLGARRVAAAGDVDGDGFADMIFGDPLAGPAGAAYVHLGGRFNGSPTLQVSGRGDDVLSGNSHRDVLVSGRGDDTLFGAGGRDALHAGADNDRIWVADDRFVRVDGGSGRDVLVLRGDANTWDFTGLPATRVQGIEIIQLRDDDMTLQLAPGVVLDMSDSSNTVKIKGAPGSTVDLVGDWHQVRDVGDYYVFRDGQARVLIEHDLTVI
jgi:hypothetical protein